MAQRYGSQLLEELPELDSVMGIAHCGEIDKLVEAIQCGQLWWLCQT